MLCVSQFPVHINSCENVGLLTSLYRYILIKCYFESAALKAKKELCLADMLKSANES